MKLTKIAVCLIGAILLATCQLPQGSSAEATYTSPVRTLPPLLSLRTATTATSVTPEVTATPEDVLIFAVIGDYGAGNTRGRRVAELVDSWNVGFIVTTGDNNYPDGEAETIDDNIGRFYSHYIGNYVGEHGAGSEVNRFFPSLGNHDWSPDEYDPYLDYFTLPGNERYYDFVQGPVHFFILNSDEHEPDGVGRSSNQAAWLQAAMEASAAYWQIVIMHHPPFSSGEHGSIDWMQWPFADWGADAILAGHDHLYERLVEDGLLYITNGLGGHSAIYSFVNILPESQMRYNELNGAMRVQATSQWMLFEFINRDGEVVDSITLDLSQANP